MYWFSEGDMLLSSHCGNKTTLISQWLTRTVFIFSLSSMSGLSCLTWAQLGLAPCAFPLQDPGWGSSSCLGHTVLKAEGRTQESEPYHSSIIYITDRRWHVPTHIPLAKTSIFPRPLYSSYLSLTQLWRALYIPF